MSITRRSFIVSAGAGASLLVLTACTDTPPVPKPTPTPLPTNSVPTPTSLRRSDWSNDPLAMGAVSFLPLGATPLHRENLAQNIVDRVFFAGEATADEPSTVRGARSSGARAAGEVFALVGDGERVAVIGAGAAGAECARRLSAFGVDVVVLEARDRTGGRIHSTKADVGQFSEFGAWRLGAESDAEIIAALDRLDVPTNSTSGPDLMRDPDGSAEVVTPADTTPANSVGARAVTTAVDWAAVQVADSTLDAALEASGARSTAAAANQGDLGGAALLEQYLRGLAVESGAEASTLSAWFTPLQTGEERAIVTGPFVAIVDDDLDGIETFLSTAVLGISYDDDGVRLRLGTGESLSVDRVVVTVPLGVLKAAAIEFSPLLPFGHRAAINAISVGAVELVKATFDEPFWTTDATTWSLVGTDELITSWVNLLPITGEPALLGVVGGEAALALAGLTENELAELVSSSLEPFADNA
ncbi:monoamine oxidase [Salinibacterium sp. CAN_S4]|uniref:flavin monoamine oxidase family protein n=1 Tax=Salinibacterium sp. CAN_S4 TaxID=2787727 RepID=UPI0018EFAEA7